MCLICMKYRIIILIIIIKRLGEILLSYIAHTSRTHTPLPLCGYGPGASINNQTEIVNGERGHYLVWSVRVKG